MSGGTLSKAFVPLPAGDEAVYTANGLAYYRHKDWRGSSPLATTPSRTMYSDVNYAPYGESYPTGAADLNFTGDNQDMLAGLYDTDNRELPPNQGRWISPDPAGLGAADPTNPQSWNRYAYVMNDPLALVDPMGLDCVTADEDGGVTIYSGDCPGIDPNNEYYYPCDGCLMNSVRAYYDQAGNLILESDDGTLSSINNFDYTAPTDPADPTSWWGTFFGNLSSNWSWGVRAPNQTYRQCLSRNSSNYSLAGALNQQGFAAQLVAGNDVASILFGEADGTTGLYLEESAKAGAGTALTFGRRTASIFNLNLSGTTGPAAAALAKTGVKGIIETAGAYKLAADLGATIALLGGCLAHP